MSFVCACVCVVKACVCVCESLLVRQLIEPCVRERKDNISEILTRA